MNEGRGQREHQHRQNAGAAAIEPGGEEVEQGERGHGDEDGQCPHGQQRVAEEPGPAVEREKHERDMVRIVELNPLHILEEVRLIEVRENIDLHSGDGLVVEFEHAQEKREPKDGRKCSPGP